jgi:hypothetical protein
MKTTNSKYLSLTPDDISNIKGEPMSKRIYRGNDAPISQEEWVYYRTNDNTKEHYFFKDGRLVKYKMEEAV